MKKYVLVLILKGRVSSVAITIDLKAERERWKDCDFIHVGDFLSFDDYHSPVEFSINTRTLEIKPKEIKLYSFAPRYVTRYFETVPPPIITTDEKINVVMKKKWMKQ
jgi:hypothetical protein